MFQELQERSSPPIGDRDPGFHWLLQQRSTERRSYGNSHSFLLLWIKHTQLWDMCFAATWWFLYRMRMNHGWSKQCQCSTANISHGPKSFAQLELTTDQHTHPFLDTEGFVNDWITKSFCSLTCKFALRSLSLPHPLDNLLPGESLHDINYL